MRTNEDCSAFGWADGMHLVSGLDGGMRSPSSTRDAAGGQAQGFGGSGTEAWNGRRTQEGHDANSRAEAGRILGAALEGRQATEAEILWALRQTGDL